MVQAAVLGGQFFDLFSLFDDSGVASKVGVSWSYVADALVVALSLVFIDVWLIFVSFRLYDEPDILPYQNPSICPINADVKHLGVAGCGGVMKAKSDFLDGFHGGAGSKPTLRFGRTINGLAGRRGRAPDVGANSNRRRRTACYVSIAGAKANER